MKSIKSIAKKIGRLKPVPQVSHKILEIVEDPESSMSDLSDVITYDAAVTANLLKVSNSAYFGLPGKFESAHQAIVYLGMDQVVDLVLLGSTGDNLKNAHEGYDLGEGELWKHSVSCAILAKELAEKKQAPKKHLIFTAALLKDIGKVVLSQHVAESYQKINTLVTEKGYSFREAEKKIIGVDHAELGGIIAETWKFSSRLVEIIRHHHSPQKAKNCEFETSIVYLADTLCMMMGIGVGADGLAYRFHKDVLENLKVSEKDIQEVIADFGEIQHKVDALLGIN